MSIQYASVFFGVYMNFYVRKIVIYPYVLKLFQYFGSEKVDIFVCVIQFLVDDFENMEHPI